MAKRQKKSVELLLPIDGLAVDKDFTRKADLLVAFCEANGIPCMDDAYDFSQLLTRCISTQQQAQYHDIEQQAIEATLANKGHIRIEGIPTTDEDDIAWGLFDSTPVFDGNFVTHVRMTVQDPDVAMLIKLAAA